MTEVEPCKTCGLPHVRSDGTPSCTGHSRGRLRPEIAGKACRQRKMRGQEVCKVHGGKAPQNLAKGAERAARAEAEAELTKLAATLGDVVEFGKDPGEIVAEQIDWGYAHVGWLRERVRAVDPKALVWGKTKVKKGGDDYGTTREAKPNAWYVLYREASRDLEKLCIDAIRAGLEARRVRLAEMKADMLVELLDGVLSELGLDPNAPETAEVVERRLRLVGA